MEEYTWQYSKGDLINCNGFVNSLLAAFGGYIDPVADHVAEPRVVITNLKIFTHTVEERKEKILLVVMVEEDKEGGGREGDMIVFHAHTNAYIENTNNLSTCSVRPFNSLRAK